MFLRGTAFFVTVTNLVNATTKLILKKDKRQSGLGVVLPMFQLIVPGFLDLCQVKDSNVNYQCIRDRKKYRRSIVDS